MNISFKAVKAASEEFPLKVQGWFACPLSLQPHEAEIKSRGKLRAMGPMVAELYSPIILWKTTVLIKLAGYLGGKPSLEIQTGEVSDTNVDRNVPGWRRVVENKTIGESSREAQDPTTRYHTGAVFKIQTGRAYVQLSHPPAIPYSNKELGERSRKDSGESKETANDKPTNKPQ
ncbi:hypothetical protein STEG23_002657 [Scotinomys teguina]